MRKKLTKSMRYLLNNLQRIIELDAALVEQMLLQLHGIRLSIYPELLERDQNTLKRAQ